MAHPKAAWGMEIGADAIKAIRLERDGDKVTVSDFAVIPHKKVLTTPDMDRDEMVRIGLGQFISQKVLEGQTLVMSVPGHAAFARFAKLPPVEPKKVPDIVRFEAVQQIPFPIDQVEWDYETFITEGSPEIEVGIFAITRERVQQRLGLYAELGIVPESLTLSPVAVYNAMAYEHDLARNKKAIIYIDIGTSATDLIVADQNRCWGARISRRPSPPRSSSATPRPRSSSTRRPRANTPSRSCRRCGRSSATCFRMCSARSATTSRCIAKPI
jgi:type IV pilus assembly protein PilM